MDNKNKVELFDSSKFIDEETRISIRLKRKSDIVPSPWEIGNLIDNLSRYYYKMELLNVISKAISNNISPKNIFILDESFKLNQGYNNLDTMSITDIKIKSLYTIGLPISLYPNKNVFMLYMIFKTFRRCNEEIYKYTKKFVTRDEIVLYTDKYFNKQILEKKVIEGIVDNAISFVNKKCLVKSVESKTNLVNELLSIKANMVKEFEKYKLDEKEMPTIENMLESYDDYNDKKELIENKVYKEYYTKFFYLMTKVSRPVVCIYYDETKQIQILSLAHINQNKRNNTFFDVKNISHNSPLITDLITGAVSGTCTIIKTKDELEKSDEIHEKKLKQEELKMKILEAQYKKANAEAEKAELEKIEKEIELYDKINEMNDKYRENPAKSVDNKYLNHKVFEAYGNIRNGSQRLLSANKLEVQQIEEIQEKQHIDTTV